MKTSPPLIASSVTAPISGSLCTVQVHGEWPLACGVVDRDVVAGVGCSTARGGALLRHAIVSRTHAATQHRLDVQLLGKYVRPLIGPVSHAFEPSEVLNSSTRVRKAR